MVQCRAVFIGMSHHKSLMGLDAFKIAKFALLPVTLLFRLIFRTRIHFPTLYLSPRIRSTSIHIDKSVLKRSSP